MSAHEMGSMIRSRFRSRFGKVWVYSAGLMLLPSERRGQAITAGRPLDRNVVGSRWGGVWAGQLRWGQLTHARVLGILNNPCYAGAYVFGRYASRRSVRPDGSIHSGITVLPMDQWPVLIRDHHPGYLSWQDYLANQAKIAANRTHTGARPAREGHALCQGIIGCGSCGRPMSTRYHRDGSGAYECHARKDQQATPTCRSVSARAVDDVVAERLLAALNPEEVALAFAAADEVTDRRARASRAAELAVERARYDADRAFHATEPENRLVVRTLETRWEARLAALAEAETALAATRNAAPPLPTRADLQTLVGDLPRLWHAKTTAARDRKRLLRTLIADITVLPETDRAKVRVGIHWHTGATDEITADRPLPPGPAARTPSSAVELIRALGPTTSNTDLVTGLNAAGHRTGKGRPFDIDAVQWVRHVHKIPTPGRSRPASSASARPPTGSASAPTPSTTGSRPGTYPPAAALVTASRSPGPSRSRPPAAPVSPAQGTSTRHPYPSLQERQYETTIPAIADRVVQAALKLVCRPADPAQPEPAGRHRPHHRRARLPRQPARAAASHRLAPRHPRPGLPMRPPGRGGRRRPAHRAVPRPVTLLT